MKVEINDLITNWVWDQVERHKDKLVVGTQMLTKRKTGQHGEVKEYKSRMVPQGFRPMKYCTFRKRSRLRQDNSCKCNQY